MESSSLFDKIQSFLNQHSIQYQIKEHPPTITSEESAKARGEDIKIGAKALLLKGKEEFVLAILPAHLQFDTKKTKSVLNTKNLRFATPEELLTLTGCTKGAVPPFGFLLNLPMIVDQRLFKEEWMAFNAGSLTTSIKMRTADYQKSVQPRIEDIAADA